MGVSDGIYQEVGIEAKDEGYRGLLLFGGTHEEEPGCGILESILYLVNMGIHVVLRMYLLFESPSLVQTHWPCFCLLWPSSGRAMLPWLECSPRRNTRWRWIFQEWSREHSTPLFLSQSGSPSPQWGSGGFSALFLLRFAGISHQLSSSLEQWGSRRPRTLGESVRRPGLTLQLGSC